MSLQRTIIIGNSGSGKSWLAERLADALSVTAEDLDLIHWVPGGYNQPRDKGQVLDMVHAAAKLDAWIMEGVYGWLATEALPRATSLIWLNINIDECIANLTSRGMRRGGDEAAFATLLEWARNYVVRQTSSFAAGHERLFHTFTGERFKLRFRSEVTAFLSCNSLFRGRAKIRW